MESSPQARGENPMLPAGLKLLGLERVATGALILFVAAKGFIASKTLQGSIALNGSGKALVMAAGVATVLVGLGLLKRKKWARWLMMAQTAIGCAIGIIAVTYAVLSWPSQWGRFAIILFSLAVLCFFAGLVALFIALAQAEEFFKRGERTSVMKRWSRSLWGAVVVLAAVRITAAWVFGITSEEALSNNTSNKAETGGTLQESLAYCETVAAGRERAQCFVQLAVAAAEAGDALPNDFCTRVGADEPQLKLLCIAYARQPVSCQAFETVRERALCRGLVMGDVTACDEIPHGEDKTKCVVTVQGYLEAMEQELEASQAR